MTTNKEDPSVIAWRQDDVAKTLEKIDAKLDRIIENYATKVELTQAIKQREERISELSNEVKVAFKRKTVQTTAAIIAAMVSTMAAIIAFYELFR